MNVDVNGNVLTHRRPYAQDAPTASVNSDTWYDYGGRNSSSSEETIDSLEPQALDERRRWNLREFAGGGSSSSSTSKD